MSNDSDHNSTARLDRRSLLRGGPRPLDQSLVDKQKLSEIEGAQQQARKDNKNQGGFHHHAARAAIPPP